MDENDYNKFLMSAKRKIAVNNWTFEGGQGTAHLTNPKILCALYPYPQETYKDFEVLCDRYNYFFYMSCAKDIWIIDKSKIYFADYIDRDASGHLRCIAYNKKTGVCVEILCLGEIYTNLTAGL